MFIPSPTIRGTMLLTILTAVSILRPIQGLYSGDILFHFFKPS